MRKAIILSQAGLNVPRLAPKLRIASVQYIINRAYTYTRIAKTMANKIFSISLRLLPFLAVAPMLMACGGSDDVPGVEPLPTERPIQFGGEVRSEVEQSTRAGGIGLEDEGYKSFRIWASKAPQSGGTQSVMNGYTVTWASNTAGTTESNTHDWEYVNTTSGQTIKYWDYNATSYRFWAYAGDDSSGNPNDGVTTGISTSDGTTFTITGLTLSTTPPKTHLFSSLNVIEPANFGKPVVMEFLHPYAKVRVMFYCDDVIDEGDKVEIGASTFAPESLNQLITKGTLKVTYPQSDDVSETYETTSSATEDYLSFDNVNLTHYQGTASNNAVCAKPTEGTDYYYAIPNAYNCAFTLSTTIEGDSKNATVPAAFMHWRPNYVYTYIFKITEAGKKIEFYDVKIDPWKYGGSQVEEWRNW